MTLPPLRAHTVLVTGAGDGIGRALAEAIAAAGGQAVLLGRTEAKLAAVHDAIVAAGHLAPIIVPGDLAALDDAGAEDLANVLAEEIGPLHGLVHNAAELGLLAPLQHYPAATWERVLHVNLTAPFLLTRALLPLLLSAPAARVLFLSSTVGTAGRAFWGAYAVSKFGLEGMAQVLREELKETSQVSVHVVNPGATATAMRATAYPAEDPQTLASPTAIAARLVTLLDCRGERPADRTELRRH